MKYFTIEELTCTDTGLVNIPSQSHKDNLLVLVEKVLDPARTLLGRPIKVNSAFRSMEVNEAVHGVKTSRHLTCNTKVISRLAVRLLQMQGLVGAQPIQRQPNRIVMFLVDRVHFLLPARGLLKFLTLPFRSV